MGGIMEKIKVLLVDDNEVVREGLKSILEPQPDIEVIGQATDGLDAVAKAEELRPDVILMDAQMPVMDGTEATKRIKQSLPGVKVLFLTVYGDYVGGALAAGASWYLTKDCRRQDLLEGIRVLAQSSRTKAKRAC
ncbi:MAG: response regulator transcription factor [Chloroflexi bacterium]|nr:response regulator transcription factor [Chloroflexota bacterium]MBM3182476.1 response regulator transcription factor [Chloroflexota bacterium]MBM4451097.1 response regulator transcription factor [Chloroflexota bacterium]MBM4453669.1 response regulator transcription factor [Chloroflexota bacterium]